MWLIRGKKEPQYVVAYRKVRDVIMSCTTRDHLRTTLEMKINYGRLYPCRKAFEYEKVLNKLMLYRLEQVKLMESVKKQEQQMKVFSRIKLGCE